MELQRFYISSDLKVCGVSVETAAKPLPLMEAKLKFSDQVKQKIVE